MQINKVQKVLSAYFAVISCYWVWLFISERVDTDFNYFYSFAFSLMPFLGGILGVVGAKVWGGFKSSLGKAVSLFSLGLFFWGSGSMVWAYYNFVVNLPAPYPSIADVGYILALVFWALGAWYLSKATGARFGLRNKWIKLIAVVLPILILAGSYYILVTVARGGVLTTSGDALLKTTLDILYPLGDMIILVLSVMIIGLSAKLMGGLYKLSLLSLLLGLIVMYAADFVFSYTTTIEKFYVGAPGDLLFSLAMYLLTFGVLGFAHKPTNLRPENQEKENTTIKNVEAQNG